MNNILITGGTRGIGKCVADLLQSKDWNVLTVGRAGCDMMSNFKVGLYLSTFPPNIALDAIVFSHGEWYSRPFETHEAWDYRDQFISRVESPIRIISYFAKQLEMSPIGSVVFVSSTRGFIGGVETAPYSLACAAQIALVQGFAREYRGIRFNCLAPGLTQTDLGKEVVKTGGAKPDAPMQDPNSVAVEVVKLIESKDNGRIIRVVNDIASEAKWIW